MEDTNVKEKIIMPPEELEGKYLYDLGIGQDFSTGHKKLIKKED